MPTGIEDRNADVWEALLAVADVAGADWPERGRRSAVALVAASKRDGGSLGIRLLTDIRQAFTQHGTDRLTTDQMLDFLTELDEAPWGDLRGKPLDARGLSRRLGRYDISPKNLRIDGRILKGYDQSDLADVWSRYVPDVAQVAPPFEKYQDLYLSSREAEESETPPSGEDAATSATPLHALGNPICSACGRANLYAPASIARGTCAACVRSTAARSA
jgi:hypothetical protein